MDWFQVDWKGPFSLEQALVRPEAGFIGVYAIYEMIGRNPATLLYIGMTYGQGFGMRLKQHRQKWLWRSADISKIVVCFGTIVFARNRRISHDKVHDVERFLIHCYAPRYNDVSKEVYSGRDILLINTGKKLDFATILSDDPDLLNLLKAVCK